VAAYGWNLRPKVPLHQPLRVFFGFVMPRPAYHFVGGNKKGKLKASAPRYHTVRPDVVKLQRSTEDALTKIIWVDDSQTYDIHAVKHYGEEPGCQILIEILTP
jgi:Holliday junction resolvase RusA-like endonuclease